MFRKNEGPADRGIRVAAGALLVAVGLFGLDGLQASILGLAVVAFGVWFIATGAVGVCPLYRPFGITTVGTTHGPFGIRLRRVQRPLSTSPRTDVPLVHRSREDALR
jgi:Inner membrane protein YgaP-like, transmembrane domain